MQLPIPRRALLIAGLLTAIALAGCGSTPAASPTSQATIGPAATATTAPAATATAAPAASATAVATAAGGGNTVDIFDFGYRPSSVDVSVGTTVTWTNSGNAPHTVTFDDGTDSGTIADGGTYEQTFDSAGSFAYHCAIHPAMRGTVTVAQ